MDGDGNKYLMQVMSRSSSNFRNLNQDLHVILYNGNMLFDYIVSSREVRPYNTGHWHKIVSSDESEFLEWIYDIYTSILSEERESSYYEDYNMYIGFKVGHILAIDLSKALSFFNEFKSNQIITKDNLVSIKMEIDLLIIQCTSFINKLSKLYHYWDSIIKKYDDDIKL